MKEVFKSTFLLASAIGLCNGCASILSKSSGSVTITSIPSGAEVTIKDKHGRQVQKVVTPSTLNLRYGAGYFSSAQYTFQFEKEGYVPYTKIERAGFNGWYFGNFLFGGPLGLLVVDPATGAMWKLKDTVFGSLEPRTQLPDKNPKTLASTIATATVKNEAAIVTTAVPKPVEPVASRETVSGKKTAVPRPPEVDQSELEPGWGVFQGSMSLVMATRGGSEKVISPIGNTCSGTLSWKSNDGSFHVVKVNEVAPCKTEMQVRLANSENGVLAFFIDGHAVTGVILVGFQYPGNKNYYKGWIEEEED